MLDLLTIVGATIIGFWGYKKLKKKFKNKNQYKNQYSNHDTYGKTIECKKDEKGNFTIEE